MFISNCHWELTRVPPRVGKGQEWYTDAKPFFFFSVPSRAPDILQVRSSGPRNILIKWSPVPEQFVHGILRGYNVYYRTGMSKSKRSVSHVGVIKAMSVNTSIQSLDITGLEPFTYYDVWVSAFTDIGSSPSSRPITVITDEDGKLPDNI